MYSRCPKCGHAPLPIDQALPAACPGCGVILAKIGALPRREGHVAHTEGRLHGTRPVDTRMEVEDAEPQDWRALLVHVPDQVDPVSFWMRLLLLAAFGVWGVSLIALDVRDGAMNAAFLHRPLLVFHEAGHVIFMPFGEWICVMGGTLGQLLMPLVLGGALLLKNRDPFGASVGLWFLGVSLLDVAPYMFDALHPQLILLGGHTGEDGGHDWIFLFSSMGILPKAQLIGSLTHKLGALVIFAALVWAAWLLRLQFARRADS